MEVCGGVLCGYVTYDMLQTIFNQQQCFFYSTQNLLLLKIDDQGDSLILIQFTYHIKKGW